MTGADPRTVGAAAAPPTPRRRRGGWAIAAYGAVVLLIGLRTFGELNVPGQPHLPRFGLVDFRDAIYYPVVALVRGDNPYDATAFLRDYPVNSTFALYAPHTLLLHLPLGGLSPRAAGWVYFLFTALLVPALAWLILRLCGVAAAPQRIWGLAALLLLSRPGQSTLFLGQYTVTVVLGVCIALAFADRRPGLGGLGVVLAALKPTFGLPLVVLLLARGAWRAVGIGLGVAALLAAAPLARIVAAAGGVRPLLELLRANHGQFFAAAHAAADASATRIDVVSLLGRLVGSGDSVTVELALLLPLLGCAACAVARLARDGGAGAARLSDALVCLTILCCVYHQGYDALLLALPLTGLLAAPQHWPPMPAPVRWLLVALLALPLLNYLSTFRVIEALGVHGSAWTALASLNAGALLVVWTLLVGLAWRPVRAATGCAAVPLADVASRGVGERA